MQVEELSHWLADRLPAELLAEMPRVSLYDDELIILLTPCPAEPISEGEDRHEQERTQIERLREQSRSLRMQLADALQPLVGRHVSWGMRLGESEALFTARTVPVMTRLDRFEREVLDTLVAAGVAETRSAALAYCVRAFAGEHADWLREMRHVIEQVQQVRSRLRLRRRQGPPPGA